MAKSKFRYKVEGKINPYVFAYVTKQEKKWFWLSWRIVAAIKIEEALKLREFEIIAGLDYDHKYNPEKCKLWHRKAETRKESLLKLKK